MAIFSGMRTFTRIPLNSQILENLSRGIYSKFSGDLTLFINWSKPRTFICSESL
jgi:hypothetical protein